MPFKNIKYIFFDLDYTLWDFEKNSKETLTEIIDNYTESRDFTFTSEEFYSVYRVVNDRYWELYRNNLVSKEDLRINRFKDSLLEFGVDDLDLASDITEEYISKSPEKTNLFPYAKEVLEYLKSKYKLYLITNGFDEVQYRKIKASKLDEYFEHMITSEAVGVRKPDPLIFEYSLDVAKASAHESLMIGDSYEADVLGALNSKMRAIYFNHNNASENYENVKTIHSLSELSEIL